MNAMICPNCGGTLVIEHYNIALVGTKALGVSSRLACTSCSYKKEPKHIIDPRLADMIKLSEKPKKRADKERINIYGEIEEEEEEDEKGGE